MRSEGIERSVNAELQRRNIPQHLHRHRTTRGTKPAQHLAAGVEPFAVKFNLGVCTSRPPQIQPSS
jgi:hypothetical protein